MAKNNKLIIVLITFVFLSIQVNALSSGTDDSLKHSTDEVVHFENQTLVVSPSVARNSNGIFQQTVFVTNHFLPSDYIAPDLENNQSNDSIEVQSLFFFAELQFAEELASANFKKNEQVLEPDLGTGISGVVNYVLNLFGIYQGENRTVDKNTSIPLDSRIDKGMYKYSTSQGIPIIYGESAKFYFKYEVNGSGKYNVHVWANNIDDPSCTLGGTCLIDDILDPRYNLSQSTNTSGPEPESTILGEDITVGSGSQFTYQTFVPLPALKGVGVDINYVTLSLARLLAAGDTCTINITGLNSSNNPNGSSFGNTSHQGALLSTTNTTYNFIFPTPARVISNESYGLAWFCNSATMAGQMFGSASDTYPNGACFDKQTLSGYSNCETLADIYFDLGYNYTGLSVYSGCGNINESGVLSNNVSSTGTCMTVTADNVDFDCQGNQITWNTAGGSNTFGITGSSRNNVTLRNCNITDGNAGGSFGMGINLSKTSNITLLNNTVQTNGTNNNVGLYLEFSNNSNITLNTVQTNGTTSDNYGIALFNSSTGIISNNFVRTGGTSSNYAVYLLNDSNNNTIRNNTINGNGTTTKNSGIVLQSIILGTNITNNDIRTGGTTTNHGIYLTVNVHNTTVDSNVVRTNGSSTSNFGIYGVTNIHNSTFSNNTVIASGSSISVAFVLDTGINNNLVRNNSFTGRGFSGAVNDALSIQNSSQNNTVYGNFLHASGTAQSGIAVSSGSNNSFVNNTINLNGTAATNRGIFATTSIFDSVFSGNTILTRGTTDNYGIEITLTGRNNTIENNTIRTNGSSSKNIGIYLFTAITTTRVFNNTVLTSGSTNNDGISIETTGTSNLLLSNTINTTGTGSDSDGISIFDGAVRNNITGNVVRTAGTTTNDAIALGVSSHNNSITNNTLNTVGTTTLNRGVVVFTSAHDNNITQNIIQTSGSTTNYGIELTDTATGNRVFNNTIRTSGTSTNHGIFLLTEANGNNVSNNYVTPNGSSSDNDGIVITGSRQNIVNNNTIRSITTTGGDGISLSSLANNNNFTNNNILTETTGGAHNGILSTNASSNFIFNNTININGSGTGMKGVRLIQDSNNNTVRSNFINVTSLSNTDTGVDIETTSSRNNITNNTILVIGTNAIRGIRMQVDTYLNTAFGNYIQATSTAGSGNHGVHITTNSYSNTIFNNSIVADTQGVFLDINVSNNTVSNNSMLATGSTANIGINMSDGFFGNNVSGNVVLTNGSADGLGISLTSNGANNSVENNTIVTSSAGASPRSQHGILLFFMVTNNTIKGNVISTIGASSDGIRLRNGSDNNTFNNNFMSTLSGSSYGISITDSSDNRFNGTIMNFTKVWIHSGAGSLNNFSNTTFMTGNGSINSTPLWTLNGLQNITQLLLNITNNTAFSNSSNLTMINTTAQITLKGLTFGNPQPLYDENDTGSFVICTSPQCVEESYVAGVFVFNVTRFSTYSSNESVLPIINTTLLINKTDSVDPLNISSTTTFNYTITINISGNATNITVNDTFPSQIAILSTQPTPITGTNNSWFLGNLNDTIFLINISANVTSFYANGTVINNTANVTYLNSTGSYLSRVATETTTLLSVANITIVFTKNDSSDPFGINLSTVLNYTITINVTNGTPINITVTEFYPTQVSFISSQPNPSTGNNTWNLGNITGAFLLNISVNVSNLTANGTVINNTVNLTFQNNTGGNFTLTTSQNTTILYISSGVIILLLPIDDAIGGQLTGEYNVTLPSMGASVIASNCSLIVDNVTASTSIQVNLSGNYSSLSNNTQSKLVRWQVTCTNSLGSFSSGIRNYYQSTFSSGASWPIAVSLLPIFLTIFFLYLARNLRGEYEWFKRFFFLLAFAGMTLIMAMAKTVAQSFTTNTGLLGLIDVGYYSMVSILFFMLAYMFITYMFSRFSKGEGFEYKK